jgi:poly(beta-D-mannuronate) lyase
MKITCLLIAICTTFFANSTIHLVSSIDEANKLLNAAKPMDTILLKDGTYKNAVLKFTNTTLLFAAEHAGKVFFEGNSTLSFGGKKNIIDGFIWQKGGKDVGTKSVIEFRNDRDEATYSTLKNCVIAGYNTSDLNIDNKWVAVYGTYNTVTNCLLKDKFNRGATLTVWLDGVTEAHHTISYNYFLNRQNGPNVDNGLESIRIGDSKTSFTPAHCVVAFNRFEKCDGEIEIISNKSCHNSYLHNTFVNNDGGLTLRHGNDCLVDGNFFDGTGKEDSYGVRFIGEGHVAINNYFYQLLGSPHNAFRSPVTIVNGLVNTPLNGYFQVRRAVIADNIFVNNNLPNIRVGSFSNREGMTVEPDTLLIENNFMLDENGAFKDVYEERTKPKSIIIINNTIIGKKMSSTNPGFKKLNEIQVKRDGFISIKDNKNNLLASIEQRIALKNNLNAGANWVNPVIVKAISKKKYSIVASNQVGPIWMQ